MIVLTMNDPDGLIYARGFVNQEGLTFYILRGFGELFNLEIVKYLTGDLEYRTEETDQLPGSSKAL